MIGRAYTYVNASLRFHGAYQTPSLRHLLPWLLIWGASARVLSPPEVVDRVRSEAEALSRAYAEG